MTDLLNFLLGKGVTAIFFSGMILGFGLLLFVLYKITIKFIKPKYEKLDKACDQIDNARFLMEGQLSFSRTIVKHEGDITIIRQSLVDVKQDVSEVKDNINKFLASAFSSAEKLESIKKDVNKTLNIIERRKLNQSVLIERRKIEN